MDIIEIILIAFALAMDAFAVSITLGMKKGCNNTTLALKAALVFSGFQAMMPLIGFALGDLFKDHFDSFGSIIAFILLVLIGLNMIREWYTGNEIDKKSPKREFSSWSNILLLGIATSIDAFSVGFSLSLIDLNIYISALIIGVVTFGLSYFGVHCGIKLGCKFTKAELIGGLILILIGFRVLFG